jgi:crotonobetainyl-CoA:carnitine CoA-transferase CaiB-like acyl-CoA transferase
MPPLDGILVADFSRVLAGPLATMLLADLGADVVKVESPRGDDTRGWMPPVCVRRNIDTDSTDPQDTDDRCIDTATYFYAVNRGKRSVTLNFAVPDDLRAARALAARADVMVENFRPGGLHRYGLDYESVRAANPGVVYASISGFGPGGEGAGLPGYDLMIQALSGLMSVTGDPGGPPMKAGVAVFDVMAGLHATIGVLAALRHRDATGEGQHVAVDLLTTALSGLVNQASAYVAGAVVPRRMGNAHPSIFPYEPLPTSDADLVVIAGNDGQFARLCEVLGLPGVAADPRFARNRDRTVNREILRPLLVARLQERPAVYWFRVLTEAGVPAAPINTVADGVAFAESLGLAPVGAGPAAGTIRNPVTLSATPVTYRLPPPSLDQHGAQIRRWLADDRQQRPT